MANRWGKLGTVTDFMFLGSRITADGDCSHEIKTLAPWKKSYDQTTQHIEKQRHYFVNKGPFGQSYGFSSSHGWMWELYYKESWVLKNWCFWTVVLEKILESPLCCSPLGHKESEQLNWTDSLGFPGGASGKESACQRRRCKRHRFNHWVGKIPWGRKWLHTPVFLPGKFHGHKNLEGYNPWGHKVSNTTEHICIPYISFLFP